MPMPWRGGGPFLGDVWNGPSHPTPSGHTTSLSLEGTPDSGEYSHAIIYRTEHEVILESGRNRAQSRRTPSYTPFHTSRASETRLPRIFEACRSSPCQPWTVSQSLLRKTYLPTHQR